jgi:hypothetical protein
LPTGGKKKIEGKKRRKENNKKKIKNKKKIFCGKICVFMIKIKGKMLTERI